MPIPDVGWLSLRSLPLAPPHVSSINDKNNKFFILDWLPVYIISVLINANQSLNAG